MPWKWAQARHKIRGWKNSEFSTSRSRQESFSFSLLFPPPFLSLSFLTFTACYLTVARAFVYSCLNLYTWYYSYTGWQASRFMFNASVNVSFRGNALRIHPITWLVVTKCSWHWWLLPCFHIIVQLCIFILYQLWIYDFSFKGVVNNRWAFISVSGIFSG